MKQIRGILVFACVLGLACDHRPPTGEEVLRRYVDALGGAEAFDAVNTRHQKLTLTAPPSDDEFLLVIDTDRDLGVHVLTIFPNQKRMQSGFCDGVAWAKDWDGAEAIEGQVEHERMRIWSFIKPETSVGKLFAGIQYVDRTTFDDLDCHHLKLTTTGGLEEDWYFSVSTRLLAGRHSPAQGETNMSMTRFFRNYRETNGIKAPHSIESIYVNIDDGSKMRQKAVLTQILYNNELPRQLFVVPPELRER